MAGRDVERELEKARLLQQSRDLREQWSHYARGVRPVFTTADTAHRGWQWLKAHPVVPVVIVVTVVVVRPALAWRIGQGVWAGWKAWQRWRHVLVPPADENSSRTGRL